MKTAISIDDDIFKRAEQAATELGLSRSALFSKAIEEYLSNHLPQVITERYNQVYTGEKPDEEILKANAKLLAETEWE